VVAAPDLHSKRGGKKKWLNLRINIYYISKSFSCSKNKIERDDKTDWRRWKRVKNNSWLFNNIISTVRETQFSIDMKIIRICEYLSIRRKLFVVYLMLSLRIRLERLQTKSGNNCWQHRMRGLRTQFVPRSKHTPYRLSLNIPRGGPLRTSRGWFLVILP